MNIGFSYESSLVVSHTASAIRATANSIRCKLNCNRFMPLIVPNHLGHSPTAICLDVIRFTIYAL
jgi:hypothetical protein